MYSSEKLSRNFCINNVNVSELGKFLPLKLKVHILLILSFSILFKEKSIRLVFDNSSSNSNVSINREKCLLPMLPPTFYFYKFIYNLYSSFY